MKIITLHTPININELYTLLHQKLNPLFQKRKKTDTHLTVSLKRDAIEISQPQIYEGILFSIITNGAELWITRNEHYIDDVNSLTIESVLNDLFADMAGKGGTDLVQEG